jgi:Protein of unknown function (DUF3909)
MKMKKIHLFDERLDTIQKASLTCVTEAQVEAFHEKYAFRPIFEYGRDDNRHYIIRTTKEMFKELEYYCALKYEQDRISLYMEAEIEESVYVVVAYHEDTYHLEELFLFLGRS